MSRVSFVIAAAHMLLLACGEAPSTPDPDAGPLPDAGPPPAPRVDAGPLGEPLVVAVDDSANPIVGNASVRIQQGSDWYDVVVDASKRATVYVPWSRGNVSVTVLANDRMVSVIDLDDSGISTFPITDGVLTIPLEPLPVTSDSAIEFTVPGTEGTVVANSAVRWFRASGSHHIFVPAVAAHGIRGRFARAT